jgi:hypothetical protein
VKKRLRPPVGFDKQEAEALARIFLYLKLEDPTDGEKKLSAWRLCRDVFGNEIKMKLASHEKESSIRLEVSGAVLALIDEGSQILRRLV